MATINYNGMALEEVTTPQIFDPPKKCVCWNDEFPLNKSEAYVAAILPVSSNWIHRVFVRQQNDTPGIYSHCALLLDPPKPRRATWLEVARWCATGNGLVYDTYRDKIDTGIMFKSFEGSEPIMDEIKVSKWSDTEWHEPTTDYLGIDDKDYNFNKKYGEV